MRIVLSGIFYPMAILRYFESALKRRGDIELFTVGPYTGSWIPWSGGTNLLPKYAKVPDLPLPMNGNGPPIIPIAYVEQQLPWQPDVWLQIDAGWYLRGRPNFGKNIIIGTDPHVLNYDAQRQLADTFYCMQTPYMKEGDKYLPYGFDPIWHAPEEQTNRYDACLLGLHYDERNALVSTLAGRGLEIYYDLGPVFDEARVIYNQAHLALAWSSKLDLCARVFEGAAMGRVVVTNRVPDLTNFFNENTDLIAFNSLGEAIEKVMDIVNDPERRQSIAAAGRAAVRPHSWDVRIQQVLDDL